MYKRPPNKSLWLSLSLSLSLSFPLLVHNHRHLVHTGAHSSEGPRLWLLFCGDMRHLPVFWSCGSTLDLSETSAQRSVRRWRSLATPKKVEKSTLPETNSSPLKIDPSSPGDSYWKPIISRGELLVSGRVRGHDKPKDEWEWRGDRHRSTFQVVLLMEEILHWLIL